MGVVGKDRGLESWKPWYNPVGDVSETRQGVVEQKNKYVLTVGRREAANKAPLDRCGMEVLICTWITRRQR
ncbi:hypothetical protein J14TS5_22870 [Paenibacillus lautus]|nr:hypothetical protein J14TS5_22870 [Paenibacillus lautus]